MGLVISKRLAQMMGGEIGVNTTEGKGSEFWFTAWLDKQPDKGGPSRIKMFPENFHGKRILAVDGNALNREVIEAYLDSWQSSPTIVGNAEDALDKMVSAFDDGKPYHVAIIDSMMPGMDGAQLVSDIKDNKKLASTRLIVLMSSGFNGDAAKMKKIGFDAYLNKPIKESDLYSAILMVLSDSPDTLGNFKENLSEKALVTKYMLAEQKKLRVMILLVEDNIINQKVALVMLKKMGCHADVAMNGKEAIKAVRDKLYDIILMDIQMPLMDGFEATRIIRGLNDASKNIPIIAMTANAMKGDREKCLEAGMDDYVAKPVNEKALYDKICLHTGKKDA